MNRQTLFISYNWHDENTYADELKTQLTKELYVIPNTTTADAMKEAERIANDNSVKGYTNIEKLFEDLDKNS